MRLDCIQNNFFNICFFMLFNNVYNKAEPFNLSSEIDIRIITFLINYKKKLYFKDE